MGTQVTYCVEQGAQKFPRILGPTVQKFCCPGFVYSWTSARFSYHRVFVLRSEVLSMEQKGCMLIYIRFNTVLCSDKP